MSFNEKRFYIFVWILLVIRPRVFGKINDCIRSPDETETQSAGGSNGFYLSVLSYPMNESAPRPEGYIPGEYYSITLQGFKTKYTEQTFRGFSLVAVKSGNQSVPIGSFKLYQGNGDLKWSSSCPHGLTHTTVHPKTKIQVRWQAPPNNEGCVEFKAMILEYRDIWYIDDGPLTKKFCQIIGYEHVIPDDSASECCACDEAKYEVEFDGKWSRQTHPRDYPTIEQLTHFSDVIGASHSSNYIMWDYGRYATDGLKELAEWGNTLQMEEELKDQGKEIRTIVKAKGLWYPNVQGVTKAVFRTDPYHHFFSLASMMGPSPDWVVGVTKINLCQKDCAWTGERTFELYPWDAGTDSGTTYMSPNNPSIPREPIKAITTTDPPTSPFYDMETKSMPPLATLTIRRQKVYTMECKNQSYYQSLSPYEIAETSEDLVYKNKPECQVGDWSVWSDCSATCGKGIRMRSRTYHRAFKAQIKGCKRQMIEKQFCNAEIPECVGSEAFNEMCVPTSWSVWSECTVTCGKGFRSRSRQFQNTMAIKTCRVELQERDMCSGGYGEDCNQQQDSRCQMTVWSEWSPCSVSCGRGTRTRTRLLYDNSNIQHCQHATFLEKEPCSAEYENCEEIIYKHKEEICVEPMQAGECSGVFPRYYYDAGLKKCQRFIYGGCRGNRNNFESEDQCVKACITGPGDSTTPRGDYKAALDKRHQHRLRHHHHTESSASNLASGHTKSPKSTSTVVSTKSQQNSEGSKDFLDSMMQDGELQRHFWTQLNRIATALNIQDVAPLLNLHTGAMCIPVDHLAAVLGVNKDGFEDAPQDCLLSPWLPWSQCSRSCGNARRERRRMVQVYPRNGGEPCPVNKRETLKCRLRPCPFSCGMGPWTHWSSCSVSCGRGLQARRRYLRRDPDRRACPRKKTQQRTCYTGVRCP